MNDSYERNKAMDLRKLKKLIDLVEESGIAELEVTEGEEKVRIVKHPRNVPQPAYTFPHVAPIVASAAMVGAPATVTEVGSGQTAGQVVRSPMVGTFCRAAKPGADPFVEIGSAVKPGDTLCILEAMQVGKEIKSEFSGTVSAVLIENGQPVEYGEPMFIIA
jgi:acetyl-CoA carboxylase biotin carboxyl carrier protein